MYIAFISDSIPFSPCGPFRDAFQPRPPPAEPGRRPARPGSARSASAPSAAGGRRAAVERPRRERSAAGGPGKTGQNRY